MTTSFLFDPTGARGPDEPREESIRIVWLLLALLRFNEVTEFEYVRVFELSQKTFKRDLAKLRAIGEQYGVTVSPLKKGVVRLAAREAKFTPLLEESQTLLALVHTVANAFGSPVTSSLPHREDTGRESFLCVRTPRLVEDSRVGELFSLLRGAWLVNARVRFDYPRSDGATLSREVEPYAVLWSAGRYYLLGYDAALRRGWRHFALDRIRGRVQRAGTFTPRRIPPNYVSEDGLGLFKTDRNYDVTIELSPQIAEAVTCRLWQRGQNVEHMDDGSARITFSVGDRSEAIRWALGFGADARIVSPPEALKAARAIALGIAAKYSEHREPIVRVNRSA